VSDTQARLDAIREMAEHGLSLHHSYSKAELVFGLRDAVAELERVTAALRELREAIESDAADRAYATDLGAGEWEAFVGKRTWDALAGGARAAREDK
jgi:hypothetical protein